MALSATLHHFLIELSDIDRGVYESIELRVARHPSEDPSRVVIRVLARAIEHEAEMEFGRGLAEAEDPALWSRTPTGEVKTWIDVGVPSSDRLHRASKRSERVVVFTHKRRASLVQAWSSRKIHRAESIEVLQLDPALVDTLAESLERNVSWFVTIHEGLLSVAFGEQSVQAQLIRGTLAAFLDAER
ncbi:MAG: YaeQ family protein [Nannocystaceae bacterium]|nr:YaeQ family protein [Nannocystaceae bacterium]